MKLWHLALISAVALAATACEQKQPQPTAHQETTPATAETAPPVALDPYATDPYAADSGAAPRDTGAGVSKTPPRGGKGESTLISGDKAGSRTHVVQKGDTLSSLARKYYSDQKRWKDIWEANKSVIPNKDQLKVGTKLVIP